MTKIRYRQGGDEYILIPSAADADGAGLAASKLIEVVAKPCYIEQHELIVTASIGDLITGGELLDLGKTAFIPLILNIMLLI